jgi:hypothetical protein
MRIVLALICLFDLSLRLGDLTVFYSNGGMWPTKVIYNFGWQPGFWTLHGLFENTGWTLGVFILHFSATLALLFGFRTTLSTLLVFLLYVSLHNRNLFVLQAGDDLLRLTLFWGLFLNWGAVYSLDSKKNRSYSNPPTASLAYLLLIASVYFFTALLKDDKE